MNEPDNTATTPATVDPPQVERLPGQHGKQPRRGRRRMALKPQNTTANSVAQLERVNRCKLARATGHAADLLESKMNIADAFAAVGENAVAMLKAGDLSMCKPLELAKIAGIAFDKVDKATAKPLPQLHQTINYVQVNQLVQRLRELQRSVEADAKVIDVTPEPVPTVPVIDVPAETAGGAKTLAAGSESAEAQPKADGTGK